MPYNIKDFIRLLNVKEQLLKKQEYLCDKNRSAHIKLHEYQNLLRDQMHLNERYKYSLIMDEFLDYKISASVLKKQIEKINELILKDYYRLQKDHTELLETIVNPVKCINYTEEILVPMIYCLKEQYEDWEDWEDRKNYPLIFPYDSILRGHVLFIKIRMQNFPFS